MIEPVFACSAYKWLGITIFVATMSVSTIYASVKTPNHLLGACIGAIGGALVGYALAAFVLVGIAYYRRLTNHPRHD
jgi:hypothetical protein